MARLLLFQTALDPGTNRPGAVMEISEFVVIDTKHLTTAECLDEYGSVPTALVEEFNGEQLNSWPTDRPLFA